jgi:NAD(P)-dependent dehydrogenase (short-subunit alcohol dehydrogenase family)
MINPMNMTGKTILVTGASDGLGKSTAILVSKLGAKVIMVGRNQKKLEQVYSMLDGSGHAWYSFDLTKINKLATFVNQVVNENSPLDGFVHCAGISQLRPLKMTNYDLLQDMMKINFFSFIELTKAIMKRGNFNEGMSIVVISSLAAIKGHKGQIGYSASKAAVDGAVRAMSKELAEKKVRINSIIAGMIKTNMFERFMSRTGREMDDPRFSVYALGLGEAQDVSNAVAFLLSDASRIITGTGLVVDSGAST